MKTSIRLLTVVTIASCTFIARAQFGSGPGSAPSGPDLSGAMGKLFGDHPVFAANTDVRTKVGESGSETVVPGKLTFANGKSRFEMDMTKMKSAMMPPGAADQMKEMGMDKLVVVANPEKKVSYLIYPGLEAYTELPNTDPEAGRPHQITNSK